MKFSKYICDKFNTDSQNNLGINQYDNNGIGYHLDILRDIPAIKRCIAEGSNEAWWNSERNYRAKKDLRNPLLYKEKREIFEFYGLDPDASYSENLNKVT